MVTIVDVVISKVKVEGITTVKENLMRVIQTLIHQDVEDKIIRVQMQKDQIMTGGMIKDKLNVIIVINLAIILGNAEIKLKKLQIMLRKMKKAMIHLCF